MAFLRTKNFTGQTIPASPYNANEVTIDGSADPSWNDCEVIGGSFTGHVYITRVSNLKLNGLTISNPGGIGIYVEQTGSTDLEIANCTVQNCGKDGIYVNQGVDTSAPRHVRLKLTTNRVTNVGTGVAGDTEQRNGITCYAADATIQGNTVDGVARGDGIKAFSNAYIGGNTVKNTGATGIAVRPEVPPGANKLRITGNTVSLVGRNAVSATAPGIGLYSGATTKPVPGGIEIDANTVLVSPNTPILVESGYASVAFVHDNITTTGGNPGGGDPPGNENPPPTGELGEPFMTPGTILMMKADGPPGSALLIDDDALLRAKTVALVGGAKMVAYGSAGRYAIRLDGALGSYVECLHADMGPGAADCAVEVIFRPDAVVAGACVYDGRNDAAAAGNVVGMDASNLLFNGVSAGAHSGLGRVHYVGLSQIAGTMRLYGGLTTAASVPLRTISGAVAPTHGRARFGAGIRGLILGIRVSKRTGRNLVAPTVPPLSKFPVL